MESCMERPVAQRISSLRSAMWHVQTYIEKSSWSEKANDPSVDNFAIGNPQDMPLPEYVAALRQAVEPQNKDWFAYKFSVPEAQDVVAASLRAEFGIPFESQDIAMTNAGFGALAAAIQAIIDPGDEVI